MFSDFWFLVCSTVRMFYTFQLDALCTTIFLADIYLLTPLIAKSHARFHANIVFFIVYETLLANPDPLGPNICMNSSEGVAHSTFETVHNFCSKRL